MSINLVKYVTINLNHYICGGGVFLFQVIQNVVPGYKGKGIHYTVLSKNEEANCLTIMFPGLGYTVQGPLFHYATGLSLDSGMDVLHLKYSYEDSFYDSFTDEQIREAVIYDSGAVIDRVLEDRKYMNFHLIGKSFGTIAMSKEIRKDRFKGAKAVWLTPLLKNEAVFSCMKETTVNGLCLIGTQDHQYEESRFNQVVSKSTMRGKLYPDLNHAMEYEEDPYKSIDVLKEILRDIQQYLET